MIRKHSCKDSKCPACSPKAKSPKDERADVSELVSKITDLVGNDPKKAAIILSEWVNRSDARPKKKSKVA